MVTQKKKTMTRKHKNGDCISMLQSMHAFCYRFCLIILASPLLHHAISSNSFCFVFGLSNNRPSSNGKPKMGTTNEESSLPILPTQPEVMVRQAATAVSRAFVDNGINRQTIRMPLSESMYSEKEERFVADRAIGWQGGPQETLRFLIPLASQFLRDMPRVMKQETGGLTPRIQEQSLLDFDGSALLTAESPITPLWDIQAMLQPNTDDYYFQTIQTIEEQFSDTKGKSKRLFLLVNPSWRDASSWGFFGSKRAQTKILDRYEITYALDEFVVKGERISLLKVWPYDWCIFSRPLEYSSSSNESGENGKDGDKSILLGTFEERPQYNQIEDLLKSKKY